MTEALEESVEIDLGLALLVSLDVVAVPGNEIF
jgi:hypothetical protein